MTISLRIIINDLTLNFITNSRINATNNLIFSIGIFVNKIIFFRIKFISFNWQIECLKKNRGIFFKKWTTITIFFKFSIISPVCGSPICNNFSFGYWLFSIIGLWDPPMIFNFIRYLFVNCIMLLSIITETCWPFCFIISPYPIKTAWNYFFIFNNNFF